MNSVGAMSIGYETGSIRSKQFNFIACSLSQSIADHDEVFLSWTSLIYLSTDRARRNFSCHIELFLLSGRLAHRLSPQSIFFSSFSASFHSTQSTPMPNRCLAATLDKITIRIFPFLSFRVGDFVQVIRLNEP